MEFNFTPKAILSVEKEAKMPITHLIQNFSVTSLIILVKAGLKINEEQALEKIDEYLDLNETNDTLSLFVEILEGLQKKGFLPRSLKLGTMKKEMEEALANQ